MEVSLYYFLTPTSRNVRVYELQARRAPQQKQPQEETMGLSKTARLAVLLTATLALPGLAWAGGEGAVRGSSKAGTQAVGTGGSEESVVLLGQQPDQQRHHHLR
jgi:hypothetical protein